MTAPAINPQAVPFTRQPARHVPLHAQRWDWHSAVYLTAVAAVLATEAHALHVNAQQRSSGSPNWNETGADMLDWCHRTFTECYCALFAMHPDDRETAPFGKTRRLASWVFLSWFTRHAMSNGTEM